MPPATPEQSDILRPEPARVDRARLSRWADLIEFAIEAPERERVDVLVDLAAELEEAWLAACRPEVAA